MPMPDAATRRSLTTPLRLLSAALLLAALAVPAGAQINNATIEAVVVDGTGLPLPGVTVRAVSPDTGLD